MLNGIPLLHYFKSKNEYSGSHFGMRYHFTMAKQTQQQEDGSEQEVSLLRGTIWPDPWAREFTDPALMLHQDFPFSDEGRQQAAAWLENTFVADEERWHNCPGILDCDPWQPAEAQDDTAESQK